MRVVVGVTDGDWATYLRRREYLTEANFWLPTATTFRSINPGEGFLFKTKAPENRLIGGGFYTEFFELRVSEAWTVFGESNGLASEAELQAKIWNYRLRTGKPEELDPQIGCVVLRNIFFADPGDELPQPQHWGRSIVRFKRYDANDPDADYVHHAFEALAARPRVDFQGWDADLRGVNLEIDERRYGAPVLTHPRLGQGAFKASLLTAYAGTCAVTGSRLTPALEAAHIRSFASGGRHDVTNGLLLRSDIHKLFDGGYLGIDHDYRLKVSPRLRIESGNGRALYEKEKRGEVIALPVDAESYPDPEALDWHMSNVFRRAS